MTGIYIIYIYNTASSSLRSSHNHYVVYFRKCALFLLSGIPPVTDSVNTVIC